MKIVRQQYMRIATILYLMAFVLLGGASVAFASETDGTIVTGGDEGYAWSNQVGWVNFGATNGNVHVTNSGITGYAWNSNYGWINMSPTNSGVSVAANGTLSGYAWGENLGWINFSGVSISATGVFSGQATGDVIGTLTFDCTNCSVKTDYRPADNQTASETSTGTGTGTEGAGLLVGSAADAPSATPVTHINAYNVPLEITETQSGTLTQQFTNDTAVGVDVPTGTAEEGGLVITAAAIAVDSASITTTNRVLSGTIFDVTAHDRAGNLVHIFPGRIRIALQVPEILQVRNDIGVYYLDESASLWKRVPDVVFEENIARFYVDHLTIFGIFADTALLDEIEPFFVAQVSTVAAEAEIGAFGEGEEPEGIALPEQLFDIRLLLDDRTVTRIIDLVARVTFESFGRVPTPVAMTFSILNSDGEVLWTGEDSVTVETERVFTKRFAAAADAPELSAGEYTLRLHTRYNDTVEDDFEAIFTIALEEESVGWMVLASSFMLFILFLLLAVRGLLLRCDTESGETSPFLKRCYVYAHPYREQIHAVLVPTIVFSAAFLIAATYYLVVTWLLGGNLYAYQKASDIPDVAIAAILVTFWYSLVRRAQWTRGSRVLAFGIALSAINMLVVIFANRAVAFDPLTGARVLYFVMMGISTISWTSIAYGYVFMVARAAKQTQATVIDKQFLYGR